MTLFRLLLVTLIATLAIYTANVVANHGMGLLQVFFGDIAAMGWPGQFNLDFLMLLTLGALWVAWRHQFSAGGLALAVLVPAGGALFLSSYLLYLISHARGDMRVVLLGPSRAAH